MGEIANAFAEAFRDYVTDGLPASGAHEPAKVDIRALGDLIETVLASSGMDMSRSATVAGLAALPSPTAGDLAYVYLNNGDEADPANGVYQYSGGSWVEAEWFFNIIAALGQSYIDQLAGVNEAVEAATITQIIGAAGVLTDGTATTSTATKYFYSEPFTSPGTLPTVAGYFSAAGTADIYLGAMVAGDIDWGPVVGTATIPSAGYHEIDVSSQNIAIQPGDYPGFSSNRVRIEGSLNYGSGAQPDAGGYWLTTADDAAAPIDGAGNTGPTMRQNIRFRFEAELYPHHVAAQRRILDIRSSDKIAMVGTSYEADEFSLRYKPWLQIVANNTEWRIENFSVGGAAVKDGGVDLLEYLQSRSYLGGPVNFAHYGATYTIVRAGENDGAFDSSEYDNFRTLIDTVVSCGSIPIIASGHRRFYDAVTSPFFKLLARQHNGYYLDGLAHAENTDAFLGGYGSSTHNGNFWYDPFPGDSITAPHPGVRANDIAAYPVEDFVKTTLGRPRQSLRIFRVRPNADGTAPTVASVADLKYNNLYERTRIWQEIQSHHWALPTTHEKYYDDLDDHSPVLSSGWDKITSEYLTLQYGQAIALTDYTLVEAIFPALGSNIFKYRMKVNDSAATVYVWDRLYHPAGYPTISLPAGNWRPLPVVDGWVEVSGRNVPGTVLGDKAQFLIYKSGGIAEFTEPTIEWHGDAGKPEWPCTPPKLTNATELLAAPYPVSAGALVGAHWTATGTPTFGTGIQDIDLPRGATGHVVVTSANKINGTITVTADDEREREIEIEVIAARDPALYLSSGTFPTGAAITSYSHDWEQLVVELGHGGTYIPHRGAIGTWWRPFRFRSIVPRGATTIALRISSANTALLVAKASAKLVP